MPDKILKEPKDEEFQKKIDELREQKKTKQYKRIFGKNKTRKNGS